MRTTYSLHKINDPRHCGFNPDDYSRFKFGDGLVAREFGTALGEGFIRQHLIHHPIAEQIVVLSSPYSFIPTATFAMKDHFIFRLNKWLAEKGLPVVQETKVHRTITYKEDYGELSAEERLRLIGNDSFHIDRQFLQGKTLLFLDDIKITGSHERMILKMANEYDLSSDIHMLYFAELVNRDIHPNIENQLNYHAVKSIFDLEKIINDDSFQINTRIVKYLLHYEFEAFCIFIQVQTEDFVNLLYNMALGNSYHNIEAYSRNLDFISNHLFTKKTKKIQHGD
ncbi:phosphoribosyltransferase family protein [Flavitalea flava]